MNHKYAVDYASLNPDPMVICRNCWRQVKRGDLVQFQREGKELFSGCYTCLGEMPVLIKAQCEVIRRLLAIVRAPADMSEIDAACKAGDECLLK